LPTLSSKSTVIEIDTRPSLAIPVKNFEAKVESNRVVRYRGNGKISFVLEWASADARQGRGMACPWGSGKLPT
jgi:hypothetical protein